MCKVFVLKLQETLISFSRNFFAEAASSNVENLINRFSIRILEWLATDNFFYYWGEFFELFDSCYVLCREFATIFVLITSL